MRRFPQGADLRFLPLGRKDVLLHTRMCQNREHRKQQNVLGNFFPTLLLELGYQHHGRKRFQSLTEQIALVGKANLLLPGGPDPQELAHFLEGSTET